MTAELRKRIEDAYDALAEVKAEITRIAEEESELREISFEDPSERGYRALSDKIEYLLLCADDLEAAKEELDNAISR